MCLFPIPGTSKLRAFRFRMEHFYIYFIHNVQVVARKLCCLADLMIKCSLANTHVSNIYSDIALLSMCRQLCFSSPLLPCLAPAGSASPACSIPGMRLRYHNTQLAGVCGSVGQSLSQHHLGPSLSYLQNKALPLRHTGLVSLS